MLKSIVFSNVFVTIQGADTGPGTVPHLLFSDEQFTDVSVRKISAGQSPGLVPEGLQLSIP